MRIARKITQGLYYYCFQANQICRRCRHTTCGSVPYPRRPRRNNVSLWRRRKAKRGEARVVSVPPTIIVPPFAARFRLESGLRIAECLACTHLECLQMSAWHNLLSARCCVRTSHFSKLPLPDQVACMLRGPVCLNCHDYSTW